MQVADRKNVNKLSLELKRSDIIKRISGVTTKDGDYYIAKSKVDYSLKTPLSYKILKEFSETMPSKIKVKDNAPNTKMDEVDVFRGLIKEDAEIMNVLPRADKMSIYRTSIELKKVLGKDLFEEIKFITLPIKGDLSKLCKNPDQYESR